MRPSTASGAKTHSQRIHSRSPSRRRSATEITDSANVMPRANAATMFPMPRTLLSNKLCCECAKQLATELGRSAAPAATDPEVTGTLTAATEPDGPATAAGPGTKIGVETPVPAEGETL